ncbi:hypothetical protein [Saccharothrix lopnurensis]|uniref:Uncharacterized protein n=1 Tax=Saccharothrix lopnurensis TaxID=1670621 RepID=A0ABW1P8A7_9PSEU
MERELADKGLDLRDVYRPGGGPSRLTPRRVLALVEHPREGGPLWAALAADVPAEPAVESAEMTHHGWTLDRHLLAAIVDLLQAANFQRAQGKGPKPVPMPRPRTTRRITGRDFLRASPKARRVAGR